MYRLLFLSIALIACQPKQAADKPAEELVSTYLKFQKALSEDNSEHTAHYVIDMKKSLAEIKNIDSAIKTRLDASLEAYSNVSDIKTQRALFQELSSSVAYFVNIAGFSKNLYIMQCPMYFEGKGATWLQASADLVNPYYGSEMLKCGDQVTVIVAKN